MQGFERSNLVSFGLLTVLLIGLVFTLSGCGFFNQEPTAKISVDPSKTVNTGDQLTFDGSNSEDPDGSIESYDWDFDADDSDTDVTGSGKTDTHTYNNTGTYTVTLTVTDGGGKTNSTSVEITVTSS